MSRLLHFYFKSQRIDSKQAHRRRLGIIIRDSDSNSDNDRMIPCSKFFASVVAMGEHCDLSAEKLKDRQRGFESHQRCLERVSVSKTYGTSI